MMVEKEDLGLSLSLNFNFPAAVKKTRLCNSSSFQLNLMPALVSSSSARLTLVRRAPNSTNSFPYSSSDRDGVETKSFLKGIDVNRTPRLAAEGEEDAGVSSPNSTISSISGKRSDRDLAGEDHDTERASSRGVSDEEDGDNCRKKLRLSKDQSAVLEESFKEHNTLNPKQKQSLAKRLGLRTRQVEVWFQNRRARTKLKQTEVDCELMKRCCDNLTQENKRLQKELQELRALKLSSKLYMGRTTPSPNTLIMCPSCEHQKLPYNPWAGYQGQ